MSAGNEPAYPLDSADYRLNGWRGLTKRELFAAMAMQGMHASGLCKAGTKQEVPELLAVVATYAVNQADALIAALEGK